MPREQALPLLQHQLEPHHFNCASYTTLGSTVSIGGSIILYSEQQLRLGAPSNPDLWYSNTKHLTNSGAAKQKAKSLRYGKQIPNLLIPYNIHNQRLLSPWPGRGYAITSFHANKGRSRSEHHPSL
jgi:hypothetical protein